MKPYVSKIMPIIGQPIRTKKKPTPNEIEPWNEKKKETYESGEQIKEKLKQAINEKEVGFKTLKFWRFMKNCRGDFTPLVKVTPNKKRIWSSKTSEQMLKRWETNIYNKKKEKKHNKRTNVSERWEGMIHLHFRLQEKSYLPFLF